MRTSYKLTTLALGSAAVLPFIGTGTAFAADGNVSANLKPVVLNGVNGSGTASVARQDVPGLRPSRKGKRSGSNSRPP